MIVFNVLILQRYTGDGGGRAQAVVLFQVLTGES